MAMGSFPGVLFTLSRKIHRFDLAPIDFFWALDVPRAQWWAMGPKCAKIQNSTACAFPNFGPNYFPTSPLSIHNIVHFYTATRGPKIYRYTSYTKT